MSESSTAPGMPDVRGWSVRAEIDGRHVGEVADLVADASGSVSYLDVRLSAGNLTGARESGPPQAGARGATGEQLRAEERGLGAEHVALRDNNPVGDTLLGDENPAPGAGWDSREIRDEAAAREPASRGERHALVPVSRVRLETLDRAVVLEGISSLEAASLPEYRPGEAPAELELHPHR